MIDPVLVTQLCLLILFSLIVSYFIFMFHISYSCFIFHVIHI